MEKIWMFSSERHDENGHTHIVGTDSERDFIAYILKDWVEGYVKDGKVQVTELGGGWLKVELEVNPESLDPEALMDLYMDFEYSVGGRKGWYECKTSGEDGDKSWWITRHVFGPYI